MNLIKRIIVKRIIKREMKNLPKLNNFFKANTPKTAEAIGNISLILAAIAGVPVILASAGVAVPAAIVTISVYAATGGSIVKAFSKMFGVEPKEDTQNGQ
jgi:uncharacterized membrane protein YkgB